ncbi:hypothetical protein ACS3SW_06880 [Roseobacteraceae bacterium S113]
MIPYDQANQPGTYLLADPSNRACFAPFVDRQSDGSACDAGFMHHPMWLTDNELEYAFNSPDPVGFHVLWTDPKERAVLLAETEGRFAIVLSVTPVVSSDVLARSRAALEANGFDPSALAVVDA